MKEQIKDIINNSINIKKALLDQKVLNSINAACNICIASINSGRAIYFCGNGGSAADAQHLAAELSGRFYKDRRPLPSEALHTNSSYLTAVANDYGYEHIFSRIITGVGKSGDVLIGLSTSGRSKNVINAFNAASEIGMLTIGLTGSNGLDDVCDLVIHVPSKDTPRIQEAHILIGHILCQLIEENLYET